MFWTGGSKNNLQRKNKNLMISRPQFYPLRKALLKFSSTVFVPQTWPCPAALKHSLLPFPLDDPPFSFLVTLFSPCLCADSPRWNLTFFLLSQFLLYLPDEFTPAWCLGSKGLPCHLLLNIMVLFIFCLCIYTLILLSVSQKTILTRKWVR